MCGLRGGVCGHPPASTVLSSHPVHTLQSHITASSRTAACCFLRPDGRPFTFSPFQWLICQVEKLTQNACIFSCAATLHVIMFFFCPFRPTSPTYKSTHRLTNQTKLKSILMNLIWLKVLRNSCTVPYLFVIALVWSRNKTKQNLKPNVKYTF